MYIYERTWTWTWTVSDIMNKHERTWTISDKISGQLWTIVDSPNIVWTTYENCEQKWTILDMSKQNSDVSKTCSNISDKCLDKPLKIVNNYGQSENCLDKIAEISDNYGQFEHLSEQIGENFDLVVTLLKNA